MSKETAFALFNVLNDIIEQLDRIETALSTINTILTIHFPDQVYQRNQSPILPMTPFDPGRY